MSQLENDLSQSDPLIGHEVIDRMDEIVETAVHVTPDGSFRQSRRVRGRLVASVVIVAASLSAGGYAIADGFASHTGLFASPNKYSGDRSEVIDVCGRDFPSVIMEYAPTDRPLPANLTYRMIADALVTRMTEGCRPADPEAGGETQTARTVQENFEFAADSAWQLAWYKAFARGDVSAAESAIAQVDATSRRPVVELVAQEHGEKDGYSDRTVAAMREGRVQDLALPNRSTAPWCGAVQ